MQGGCFEIAQLKHYYFEYPFAQTALYKYSWPFSGNSVFKFPNAFLWKNQLRRLKCNNFYSLLITVSLAYPSRGPARAIFSREQLTISIQF